MKLWQIVFLALIAFVAPNCRPQEELQIETGKGSYGIVSVRGSEKTWVIGPIYESIEIIPGGKFFWAKRNGQWGVINRKGEVVLGFEYDAPKKNEIKNEIWFARKNGKYSVVSIGDKCVASNAVYDTVWPVYETKERFSDFTFVKRNGKFGIVSPECTELLPPVYDTVIWRGADDWPDPILYSFNGKCGMINSKGVKVLPLGYDSISVSTLERTREQARVACANDSTYFFNDDGKPFKGKLARQTMLDFRGWRCWNVSIGAKCK